MHGAAGMRVQIRKRRPKAISASAVAEHREGGPGGDGGPELDGSQTRGQVAGVLAESSR